MHDSIDLLDLKYVGLIDKSSIWTIWLDKTTIFIFLPKDVSDYWW